ncbi:ScbA/BarX family gamma-butyrolactone biosynthesis protein [Streptomyces sp. NPDC002446]
MTEAAARVRKSPHSPESPAPTSTTADAPGNAVSRIPQEYTHLRNSDRIFITGWKRRGSGEFSLTAQWPAARDGQQCDPRILTQTFRQSGLVIAHAEYGVPLSHQMVLLDFNFTTNPEFSAPENRSLTLDIDVTVSETRRSGRFGSALDMVVHIRHDDVTVARAESEFSWSSPAVYRRIRGEHVSVDWGTWPLPAPVAPELVGRSSAADVVLAPSGHPRRWQLRNDTGNTLLFDHPVDHVPGLALLEAAYQAAQATVSPVTFDPATITSSYTRYVEFDEPCWIEAELLPRPGTGPLEVQVTGTQGGHTVFRAGLSGASR